MLFFMVNLVLVESFKILDQSFIVKFFDNVLNFYLRLGLRWGLSMIKGNNFRRNFTHVRVPVEIFIQIGIGEKGIGKVWKVHYYYKRGKNK